MNNTPFNEAQDKDFTNSIIKNGTLIHLKNNPTKNGVVTECIGKGSSLRYRVFINNELLELYPSQIEISLTSNSPKNVSLNQFKMYLTKTILEHPSTSHLYSFNNSKIDFIPYQYKPVIKAIQSEQPRILIADGVGVGKTIETGIILKELKARQQIESVLIICPKPLVLAKKWYYEMLRFDEKFEQLDGKGFRYCLDECNTGGEWPLSKNRVVIPYSLFNETSVEGKNIEKWSKNY